MRTIQNHIQLIGHLGKDPEILEFESGKKIARVSIATNDSYKNKAGEKVQRTDWHKLVARGSVADHMENLLTKGNKVAIHGKLANRKYKTKDGVEKSTTEIVVEEFMLFDKPQLPF